MSVGERPPTNSNMWSQSSLLGKDLNLHSMSSIKNCKDNMRRRFNDEQIRSLEHMFETEARPELRTKQQLAKSLGLQPRQVAIWFQNKRARSKSKQLEMEYRMLKISYDNLGSKYEMLKKENEALLIQLQRLRKITEKVGNGEIQHEGNKLETEVIKLEFIPETCSPEFGLPLCEDSREIDYLGTESDILNMAQIAYGLSELFLMILIVDHPCGSFSIELCCVTCQFCSHAKQYWAQFRCLTKRSGWHKVIVIKIK